MLDFSRESSRKKKYHIRTQERMVLSEAGSYWVWQTREVKLGRIE
jgi:hypothetical protein